LKHDKDKLHFENNDPIDNLTNSTILDDINPSNKHEFLSESENIEHKLKSRYNDVITRYKIESKSFDSNFDFETKLIELK